MTDFIWTDEAIATLRRLWDSGMPSAAIGRVLGISKNAVVGKKNRLYLESRPSPIGNSPHQRELAPKTPERIEMEAYIRRLKASGFNESHISRVVGTSKEVVRRVLGYTRPGLSRAPRVTLAPMAQPVVSVQPVAAKPLPVSLVPIRIPVPTPIRPSNAACCFPIGDPGTKTFRFCDDAAILGKPYCDPHCKVAYVQVRHRAEAEAEA